PYVGGLYLVNTATDTAIGGAVNFPHIAPSETSTITITRTVPIADIIAGNIATLIQVESHQLELSKSWELSNFALSYDLESTESYLCSDEFVFDLSICAINSPMSDGNQYGCAQTDNIPVLLATATVEAGETLKWFDAMEGGNEITKPSLETVGEITYYAEASSGSCVSERTPVFLKISLAPEL